MTFEELDITAAARQMLADLDHPFASGEEVYDVTFENVQAGLRTDYLFRLANHRGGIVLGTGDLSELALGWCTYGVGDQMSHYGVNAGVPKTLVQHLIRWVTDSGHSRSARHRRGAARDPRPGDHPGAGPRWKPVDRGLGGPVRAAGLHAAPVLRHGHRPRRIAFLAHHAWGDPEAGEWPPGFPEGERPAYDLAAIRHWLVVFVQRFFASQFKRSALPNGPKVKPAARSPARRLADASERAPPRGWPRSSGTFRPSGPARGN